MLHMHSTHSYDGKLGLAPLRELLLSNGISFACMSEHTDYMDAAAASTFIEDCRAHSDGSFVFVPGFEVPFKDTHVLMLGCTTFVSSIADSDQLVAWSEAADLTILAHPVRNKFIVDETLAGLIDGVEIWNQQYDGKQIARPRAMSLLRELRRGRKLFATGGLDFHRPEHFGSPVTKIDIPLLTASMIMSALKDGQYSFGSERYHIEATTDWQPSLIERRMSQSSIRIITVGKLVNKMLAKLGLSLPKRLKTLVRSRV